jgi:cytosol alanyl aminopeptidase
MRFFEMLCLCALLCACGAVARPELTAPITAATPRAEGDSELPPEGRLPGDTRPESYRLALAVDPAKPTFTGVVTIDVTLDRPRESIWLHSRTATVAAVTVERAGAEPLQGTLEHVGDSGLSAVRLKQPVGPGRVRLVLPFEAPFGEHLSGLYRAAAEGVHYAFTQFEPVSAREAFPCFDEPRFKTPFELTLRVPKGQIAIANTRLLEQRELPSGELELRFAPTEKLPTYLVALAVGPFDVVEAPPLAKSELRDREVPLRGVAVRGRGPELGFALGDTPPLVAWLEAYFGVPYAYDKLDLIAVPDFGAGAMENAGAITFRDTLLLVKPDAPEQQKRSIGYVNAHELAHQWFGNLVTMPWWDDIWLNEAFATWMGTRAIDRVHPDYQAELGALAATHGAMELDSRAAARKIRQPIESDHDIESAFDAITYSKGGAVLSMFERYLGPERFQAGLRKYMERFRFGSATSRDLVRTLAEVASEPALEPAFFTFLEQPGVPLLQVSLECKSNQVALQVEQSRYVPLGSTVSPESTWQVPMCVRFGTGKGAAKEQCALLREVSTRVLLETDSCPTWLMPNAGAQGYYRWALSDPLVDALVARRSELPLPEQMSLASNLSASLRAGRLEPTRVLSALKALASSPHRQVVETVLRAYGLVRELLDTDSLPRFRAELARTLKPAYAKLGLLPKAGAEVSGEDKLRRASLVRALYGLAEDPTVTRELAKLGSKLLADELRSQPAGLPSELLELALSAALREGGAPEFARAEALLFAANDGLTRTRLLTAMSYVRDPALSERVLALGLDTRLRVNERLLPLASQSMQPETRVRAFAWLREHYDAFQSQLGSHHKNDLIGTASSFCSERDAGEVESFFSSRAAQIAGGPRELALTLESIRACAALEAAYGPTIRALYGPATKRAPASSAN